MYPARHIKPLLDETPYFSKTDTNLMSYAQPCKLQSVNISVATLNSFAIMSPSASELFEITTVASTPFKLDYIAAKRAEWDEYRTQVTGWELDRYLEAF